MTYQRIPVILSAAKDLSVSSASQSNLHLSCDGRNQ
jgi:hypothetical protein